MSGWKRLGLIVGAVLTLSACASPQQIAAIDDQTCQSMGATPGSDAYLQCRLIQQQRHDEQRRAVARSLSDAAKQMRDPPPSQSTHCTAVQQGIYTNIDCF